MLTHVEKVLKYSVKEINEGGGGGFFLFQSCIFSLAYLYNM